MAVKTKDELLTYLKDKTKDDTSDDTLAFIEDITDTFNDYDTKVHDQTDWKQKYEDNDKQWRQKYRDRFFDGSPSGDGEPTGKGIIPDDEEPKKPHTFKDLFTFSKKKEN